MGQLATCTDCDGFVPGGAQACPHCDAAVIPAPIESATGLSLATRRSVWQQAGRTGRLLRGAVMFAGSGAFALTMMACYGVGPLPCEGGVDNDGDGYDDFCDADCNDDDPTINPDALDLTTDGIDQNCDGVDGPVILDGPDGGQQDAGPQCIPEDEDRDFFTACGDAETPPDCNDNDSRIRPDAIDDSVDGIDQNCDGVDGDGAPADAGMVDDGGVPMVDGGAPAGDGGGGEADGGTPAGDAGQASDGGVAADAGA